MEGKILLFQVSDPEILEKIRLAMLLQKVQVKVVEPVDYNQTIGFLAGIPGASNPGTYVGPALPEPMMVLCMPQQKLDGVLAALRAAGVPPMPKAMLTPTNAGWKPVDLLNELRKEREMFGKMKKK